MDTSGSQKDNTLDQPLYGGGKQAVGDQVQNQQPIQAGQQTVQPQKMDNQQQQQPTQPVQSQPVEGQKQSQQAQGGTAQVEGSDSQTLTQGQTQAGQQVVVQPLQPQAGKPIVPPVTPTGRPAGGKEEEFVSSRGEAEKVPIVEMKEPGELPVEVEGWIERVEKDDVAEPPTVVHQGQTVVSPAQPQQVSVRLPLDDDKIKKGLQHKFVDSIRWLAEWCMRLIKSGNIKEKK